jgi:hypothetical protein
MDLDEAYSVLDVAPGADEEAAREARKTLAKVWHPDRHANDPELQKKAQKKLVDVNTAFKVLRDANFPPPAPKPPPAAPRPPPPTKAEVAAKLVHLEANPVKPPKPIDAELAAKLASLEPKRPVDVEPRRVRWWVIALLVAAVGAGTYFAIVKLAANSSVSEKSDRRPEERPVPPRRTSAKVTLGATEDEVRAALGKPTDADDTFGHWNYGSSRIEFRNGRVVGWWIRERALAVHLEPSDADVAARARARGTFGIGSSADEVIALQGTPDQIDPTFHTWHYGGAHVEFDARGNVTSFSDFRNTLRTRKR